MIDGAKMFITNAGTEITGCVTITARTGEDEISNFIVPNGTPGYDIGPPLKKMGWKSSDTRPLAFDGCRVPERQPARPARRGLAPVPRRSSTAGASRSPRSGSASRRAPSSSRSPTRSDAPAVRARRSRASRRSSSSSPTWPPRSGARAHLVYQRRLAQGPRPAVRARGLDGQALHGRAGAPRGRRGRADPRRLRLHGRVSRSRASTATPRSSRSARARTRSSAS